jgi:hypothetical protein
VTAHTQSRPRPPKTLLPTSYTAAAVAGRPDPLSGSDTCLVFVLGRGRAGHDNGIEEGAALAPRARLGRRTAAARLPRSKAGVVVFSPAVRSFRPIEGKYISVF